MKCLCTHLSYYYRNVHFLVFISKGLKRQGKESNVVTTYNWLKLEWFDGSWFGESPAAIHSFITVPLILVCIKIYQPFSIKSFWIYCKLFKPGELKSFTPLEDQISQPKIRPGPIRQICFWWTILFWKPCSPVPATFEIPVRASFGGFAKF
jgi:hypothetical protein